MNLHISSGIAKKLAIKHNVESKEIIECFYNRKGGLLVDTREQHRSTSPTNWFIAYTNKGRKLKLVFILQQDGQVVIKTAYEPNETESRIYEKYGQNGDSK